MLAPVHGGVGLHNALQHCASEAGPGGATGTGGRHNLEARGGYEAGGREDLVVVGPQLVGEAHGECLVVGAGGEAAVAAQVVSLPLVGMEEEQEMVGHLELP